MEAPGNGYFDMVDVLVSVQATRNNFYDINDRWLQSDWVAKHIHLRLDRRGEAAPHLARLAPEDALPPMPQLPSPGEVRREARDGEVYRAEVEAVRPCYALFKMTWHANWKAYVDGRRAATAMLSPGFVGVPLATGRHSLLMRYEPERWKAAVGFAGLLGVALLMAMEWRAGWSRVECWSLGWELGEAARRRLLTGAGLVLLAMPVCIPLLTSSVLWGHDGFVYFPRLVEVHQNITHGVLLPRWAPDLGRGTGQPLFLFHPPMVYYLGELWRLAGFDFVTAMNLACVVVVLLSAVGMYLLARLYFGEPGGWLGAAAYLYVPYFAVDLYVRSAMEEFAAFPFFALALYGFGAWAKQRRTRHWLLGVGAYACVLVCHFPAALLFTPLLLGFLGLTAWMEKSWGVLWRQACGFVVATGIERVHLVAGAGGAAVRGDEPRGGGKRALHEPLRVSAPVVLLPVGLRALAARAGRRYVVRDRVESSAAGGGGMDLDLAQARIGRSPPVPVLPRRCDRAVLPDTAGCPVVLAAVAAA